MSDQVWDLWFPGAGSTGLSFFRSRIAEDKSDVVLVHAAPPRLEVIVRDPDGGMLAHAADLERTAAGPISRLRRTGSNDHAAGRLARRQRPGTHRPAARRGSGGPHLLVARA